MSYNFLVQISYSSSIIVQSEHIRYWKQCSDWLFYFGYEFTNRTGQFYSSKARRDYGQMEQLTCIRCLFMYLTTSSMVLDSKRVENQ